jgi:hypothetical protein
LAADPLDLQIYLTQPNPQTFEMAGDKGSDGSITTSDGTVMTKGDVEFLMVCIQHTTGGQLVVSK